MEDCTSRDRAGCSLIANTLRSGHTVKFRATGTSMAPAIWPGDVLSVDPCPAPPIGQIALFIRDGRLIAHRVVGVANAGARQIITRGDALDRNDPPIGAGELLGSVTAIDRNGRAAALDARAAAAGSRLVAYVMRNSLLLRHLVLKIHFVRIRFSRARQRNLETRRVGVDASLDG